MSTVCCAVLPHRCVHVLCFDQFVYQILYACGVVVCVHAVVRAGEGVESRNARGAKMGWHYPARCPAFRL